MRLVVSLFFFSLVAACAVAQDSNQEQTASSDKTTTTGSNIPRKGAAVTIDKAAVQDQQMRQSGSLQR